MSEFDAIGNGSAANGWIFAALQRVIDIIIFHFFFIFSFLIKMFTRKIAIFCIFFGKCCQISESFGPSQLHHEAEKSAYTLVSKAFDMTKANISIPLITTIGKT